MKITTLIALVLFVAVNPRAIAGMSSSGGERITTEQNPWFLGDESVRYCILRSDDFSMPLERAANVLSEVMSDWTTTLAKLDPTPLETPAGKRRLTLSFTQVPCESAELKIYFGASDDAIQEALKFYAAETVGFALRQSYDQVLGRAKGLVWIAPDQGLQKYRGPMFATDVWTHEVALHNVLLHELGHVFGFPHDDDVKIVDSFMASTFPAAQLEREHFDKATSNELIQRNWRHTTGQFCGENASFPDDMAYFDALFGALSLHFCLRYERNFVGDFGQLYLEQMDGHGQLLKSLPLQGIYGAPAAAPFGSPNVWTDFTLYANYLDPQTNRYQGHAFFKAERSFLEQAWVVVAGKRISVLVGTATSTAVQLQFTVDEPGDDRLRYHVMLLNQDVQGDHH